MKSAFLPAAALLLLASLAPAAHADALGDKAFQVAAEVSEKSPTLSVQQQAQVSRELDAIRAILKGGNGPGNPGDRAYLCVSRDNDNSRPYMIAYKDFTNVVRIAGTVIDTKENCDKALGSARKVFDRLFICSTRDNDGSRPFQIVGLNGTASAAKMERSVMQTLDDCLSATSTMSARREGVIYCGSRDNDGSRPFVQSGYKFDGTFTKGAEEYASLADCEKAL